METIICSDAVLMGPQKYFMDIYIALVVTVYWKKSIRRDLSGLFLMLLLFNLNSDGGSKCK